MSAKGFVSVLIVTWICFVLVSIGSVLGERAAEPTTIERVDTLYMPPVPEFIEAWRLQCYWVPTEPTGGPSDEF